MRTMVKDRDNKQQRYDTTSTHPLSLSITPQLYIQVLIRGLGHVLLGLGDGHLAAVSFYLNFQNWNETNRWVESTLEYLITPTRSFGLSV